MSSKSVSDEGKNDVDVMWDEMTERLGKLQQKREYMCAPDAHKHAFQTFPVISRDTSCLLWECILLQLPENHSLRQRPESVDVGAGDKVTFLAQQYRDSVVELIRTTLPNKVRKVEASNEYSGNPFWTLESFKSIVLNATAFLAKRTVVVLYINPKPVSEQGTRTRIHSNDHRGMVIHYPVHEETFVDTDFKEYMKKWASGPNGNGNLLGKLSHTLFLVSDDTKINLATDIRIAVPSPSSGIAAVLSCLDENERHVSRAMLNWVEEQDKLPHVLKGVDAPQSGDNNNALFSKVLKKWQKHIATIVYLDTTIKPHIDTILEYPVLDGDFWQALAWQLPTDDPLWKEQGTHARVLKMKRNAFKLIKDFVKRERGGEKQGHGHSPALTAIKEMLVHKVQFLTRGKAKQYIKQYDFKVNSLGEITNNDETNLLAALLTERPWGDEMQFLAMHALAYSLNDIIILHDTENLQTQCFDGTALGAGKERERMDFKVFISNLLQQRWPPEDVLDGADTGKESGTDNRGGFLPSGVSAAGIFNRLIHRNYVIIMGNHSDSVDERHFSIGVPHGVSALLHLYNQHFPEAEGGNQKLYPGLRVRRQEYIQNGGSPFPDVNMQHIRGETANTSRGDTMDLSCVYYR